MNQLHAQNWGATESHNNLSTSPTWTYTSTSTTPVTSYSGANLANLMVRQLND